MKVFVAQILVEQIDLNSCSSEVFSTVEAARKWADNEIDNLAMEMGVDVVERAADYYAASGGDEYVTISIVEKEVDNAV